MSFVATTTRVPRTVPWPYLLIMSMPTLAVISARTTATVNEMDVLNFMGRVSALSLFFHAHGGAADDKVVGRTDHVQRLEAFVYLVPMHLDFDRDVFVAGAAHTDLGCVVVAGRIPGGGHDVINGVVDILIGPDDSRAGAFT